MESGSTIKVLCPKHKSELALEREVITIFGKDYHVLVGNCTHCREKYLSIKLFASNDSCVIKGQQYVYLEELNARYDAILRMEREAEKKAKDEERRKQREIAERIQAEKEAEAQRRKEEAKRKKQEAAEKLRAEIRAQQEQKAAERKAKEEKLEKQTSEREKKIQRGEMKVFRAKKLMYLPQTPEYCYNDGRKVYLLNGAEIEFSDYRIRERAWCCAKCNTAYFLNKDRNNVEKYMKNNTPEENAAAQKLNKRSSEKKSEEPVNYAVPQNTLYICKGTIACKKYGHAVESATGVMLGRSGKIIKLNTNYCPQCRKYFIGYNEYEHYKRIYGVIMGNIKITNGSFGSFDGELAQESILHLCGYSVNQNNNLSADMRREILQYMIDSKIMSKPEIITYLNGFISRNGKRANMEEAVRKWKEDINWVRNYQINRQKRFEIASIQKNK